MTRSEILPDFLAPKERFMADLQVAARAIGYREIARRTGLHREYVYRFFAKGWNPSFKTVCAIAKASGFEVTMVKSRDELGHVQSVEEVGTPLPLG